MSSRSDSALRTGNGRPARFRASRTRVESTRWLSGPLASSHPIRALWEFSLDDAGTALTYEFVALANHRKEIRSEIARYAERFRVMQTEALVAILESAGVDADTFPPAAVSVLLTSLSRVVIMERSLGLTSGHAEAVAVAERFIAQLDHD